jgi:hypothetical protein
MKFKNPKITYEAASVNINPGECFTAFMHCGESVIQIEMYITPDGIPKVLMPTKYLNVFNTFEKEYK